jgi:hypothetical protein
MFSCREPGHQRGPEPPGRTEDATNLCEEQKIKAGYSFGYPSEPPGLPAGLNISRFKLYFKERSNLIEYLRKGHITSIKAVTLRVNRKSKQIKIPRLYGRS